MLADALVSQFRRARLDLKVASAPLTAANDAIVQLDIERKRGERFLLWPGADTNRVIAQNVDRDRQQLVLFVDEPRRALKLRVHRTLRQGRELLGRDSDPKFIWVRDFTAGAKRHFLCGLDEQHCFIAQLPFGAASVEQAHRALFNPAVRDAERQTGARSIRQGEWFFVRASLAEEQAIERLIQSGALGVQRRLGVRDSPGWGNRRGRPHVVDELVALTALPADSGLSTGTVYVRGKVHHPDHATLDLRHWCRVFGNRESSGPAGVSWVD